MYMPRLNEVGYLQHMLIHPQFRLIVGKRFACNPGNHKCRFSYANGLLVWSGSIRCAQASSNLYMLPLGQFA
jgi:hypothetical protein